MQAAIRVKAPTLAAFSNIRGNVTPLNSILVSLSSGYRFGDFSKARRSITARETQAGS